MLLYDLNYISPQTFLPNNETTEFYSHDKSHFPDIKYPTFQSHSRELIFVNEKKSPFYIKSFPCSRRSTKLFASLISAHAFVHTIVFSIHRWISGVSWGKIITISRAISHVRLWFRKLELIHRPEFIDFRMNRRSEWNTDIICYIFCSMDTQAKWFRVRGFRVTHHGPLSRVHLQY